MEFHIKAESKDISRYVFCPGDQARARKIAEHFDNPYLVTDSRGYVVISGRYEGIFMTVCGTGMGGPTVAIALEELAHLGADTFVRVGSCGVFQASQRPGDVIIASGRLELAEFNEIFGSSLVSRENIVTIGGWLVEQLGDIPLTGAKYVTDQFLFYVLSAEPTRIRRIYIRRLTKK